MTLKNLIIGVFLTTSIVLSGQNNSSTSNPDSLAGKNSYVNPINGVTYTTDGEFVEYSDNLKEFTGRVIPSGVILLSDDFTIRRAISIDLLSQHIMKLDTIVMKGLADEKAVGKLIVQCTIYEDKNANIEMGYEGDLNYDYLSNVYEKMNEYGLEIRTKADSCIFQNVYEINKN